MIEVRKIKEGFSGLFSSTYIEKGDLVLDLKKVAYHRWQFPFPFVATRDTPTRTSIQVDGKHIEHHLGAFINHHCKPNTQVYTDHAVIIAKKDISPNEEITIDYEQTESELAEPFFCSCCKDKEIIGKKQSS